MCPLWPAHQIILYLALLAPIWLLSYGIVGIAAEASGKIPSWNITYSYDPSEDGPILVDATQVIEVSTTNY